MVDFLPRVAATFGWPYGESATQHDDLPDVIAVVDERLPQNGEQGRGAFRVVGMRSPDLLRETIGWQVGQPRELGKEIAEEGDSLLPFFFRRRGSVGGPALRGVCRIDRLFIPNSFQLVGHPEVHVVHKLPYGVWKIVGPTSGKFEREVLDAGQGIGVRTVVCRTRRLAESICDALKDGSCVVDCLRWATPLLSAREGGPREPQLLYPHLAILNEQLPRANPRFRVLLVDDVATTGGHLQACAAKLSTEKLEVEMALCGGKTVYDQTQGAFHLYEYAIDEYQP